MLCATCTTHPHMQVEYPHSHIHNIFKFFFYVLKRKRNIKFKRTSCRMKQRNSRYTFSKPMSPSGYWTLKSILEHYAQFKPGRWMFIWKCSILLSWLVPPASVGRMSATENRFACYDKTQVGCFLEWNRTNCHCFLMMSPHSMMTNFQNFIFEIGSHYSCFPRACLFL